LIARHVFGDDKAADQTANSPGHMNADNARKFPLMKRIRRRFTLRARAIQKAFEHWLGRRSLVGDTEIISRDGFPWMDTLEANWKTIRAELEAVLADRDRLPNLEDLSDTQRYLSREGTWKSYFFHAYGMRADENCARCPETTKLIEQIPDLKVAYFSILSPGMHIPAHMGAYKGLIRAHLGLIVPEPRDKVRMRVGKEMIFWREGECVLFDDTFEHEVWNETDSWRVVLLIDVPRPFPQPLAAINNFVLRIIEKTPFITDSQKKFRQWEKGFYGEKAA